MADSPERRSRRPRNDGGLYKKTTYRIDKRTGERLAYSYWQASKDVAPENLPPGIARKRITGTGETQSKARERLEINWLRFHSPEEVERRKTRGKPRLTVEDLYKEWQTNNERGAVSDTMARKYQGYFKLHVIPHLGKRKLDKLTETDLLLLFTEVLPSKRRINKDGEDVGQLLSTAATRNIYMALSGCLNYGVRHGYLARSPLVAIKAPQRKEPDEDIEFVSANARKLITALAEENDPNYCRWLFQFLGLRRAERLGLAWSSIRGLDTDAPTLVVSQQLARYADGKGWYIKKETKTKKHRRIVIPEPFISELRAHKAAQDKQRQSDEWKPEAQFADLIFLRPDGSIYTLNRDNDEWHKVLEAHGLPHWRGHLNRHITATWLAEQDPAVPMGTVRSILGHDSEAMAWYYAKTTQTQQTEPMRRYGKSFARSASARR